MGKSGLEGEGLVNPKRFKPNKFIITPRDENGEIIGCKLRQIKVTLASVSGQSVPVTLVRGEGEDEGRFVGSFVPVELGAHVLDVMLTGEHMGGCPKLIHVVEEGQSPLPPPSCSLFLFLFGEWG